MKILITGIKGRLGQVVASSLKDLHQLVGLDRRQDIPAPLGIPTFDFEPYQNRVDHIFCEHQIDAIIHLNILHDPRASREEHHRFNILGTSNLLALASKFKIKKFIFVSSADVYGARAENSQFLSEESPLMGATHHSGLGDLIQTDLLVSTAFWKYPEIKTVILRPSHIIGPAQNAAFRYLGLKFPITLMGFSPMVQLCHYLDLLQIIQLGLEYDIQGIFNITSDGALSLHKLLQKIGQTAIPIPEWIANQVLDVLWKTHFSQFPAPEINFLKYSCMVDDSRLRSAFPNFKPHTIENVISYFKQIKK